MSGTLILGGAILIFFIAYLTYGSWLAKKWGVDFLFSPGFCGVVCIRPP